MICLPTLHIILLMCFIFGITTWYFSLRETKIYNNYINNYMTETQNKSMSETRNMTDSQIIHMRDKATLYNSLKPPERRVPSYQYPTEFIKSQINIPSRGYPDKYQLMGNAFRENTETAYKLFGRQKYPGSMEYEYYVMGNDTNAHQIKIPIRVKGGKEIYTNDYIHIPGTDKSKGQFKVELYNLDTPRYIPIL
jgi:hypothetical protein